MPIQSFTDGTEIWWTTRQRIIKRPVLKMVEVTRFEKNSSTDASEPDVVEIKERVPVTVYEFEVEDL